VKPEGPIDRLQLGRLVANQRIIMSLSENVNSRREGHVGVVELDAPPHNYFSLNMLKAINACLENFENDQKVRSVILCANGRSFCAGADLNSGESKQKRRHKSEINPLYQEAYKLFVFPKPIVAALEGSAIGGGLGLALTADFRVSCKEAKFAASFTRLGFHPGFGLSYTLPKLVGNQQASLLFYTGRIIRGDEAKSMGLVDILVDRAHVKTEAMALASEIAISSPRAVQSIRQTMRRELGDEVFLAMKRESRVQAIQFASKDIEEGVKAMSERRLPVFGD